MIFAMVFRKKCKQISFKNSPCQSRLFLEDTSNFSIRSYLAPGLSIISQLLAGRHRKTHQYIGANLFGTCANFKRFYPNFQPFTSVQGAFMCFFVFFDALASLGSMLESVID